MRPFMSKDHVMTAFFAVLALCTNVNAVPYTNSSSISTTSMTSTNSIGSTTSQTSTTTSSLPGSSSTSTSLASSMSTDGFSTGLSSIFSTLSSALSSGTTSSTVSITSTLSSDSVSGTASSSSSNTASSITSVSATAAIQSPTGTPRIGAVFGSFSYSGCFADDVGFPGFEPATTVGDLTVESCLSTCSGRAYAGLFSNVCYCGAALSSTATANHTGVCNIPCPGNDAEICGGNTTPARKRQVATTILLSLYTQIFPVNPTSTSSSAVPIATDTAGSTYFTDNSINDNSYNDYSLNDYSYNDYSFNPIIDTSYNIVNNNIVNMNDLSIGDVYTNIIKVTYLGICNCASGVDLLTYTSICTRTVCGCANDYTIPAAPPITTTTTLCSNCGPSGSPATITITLPCGATSISTSTKPAQVTETPLALGGPVSGAASAPVANNNSNNNNKQPAAANLVAAQAGSARATGVGNDAGTLKNIPSGSPVFTGTATSYKAHGLVAGFFAVAGFAVLL